MDGKPYVVAVGSKIRESRSNVARTRHSCRPSRETSSSRKPGTAEKTEETDRHHATGTTRVRAG